MTQPRPMQPGAEVFDLGYQRYTGPRQGRNSSRWALFENGVRTLLGIGRGGRAKVLPALLFIAVMTPAVVFVVILSFLGDLGEAMAEGDFVPSAADYYSIVSLVVALFGAIMAPELLGPDRRDNVLPLYLTRPITTIDYLSMRLLAFAVVVLALLYSGQAVLFGGFLLTADAPLDYLRDNWEDIPRILLVGAAITAFWSVITLAVSAYVTRRAIAAAVIIGGFILLNGITDSLTIRPDCGGFEGFAEGQDLSDCDYLTGGYAPYIGLLSPGVSTEHVNNIVFDLDVTPESIGEVGPSVAASSELAQGWRIAAYLVWVLVPAGLLWNRYRRLRL